MLLLQCDIIAGCVTPRLGNNLSPLQVKGDASAASPPLPAGQLSRIGAAVATSGVARVILQAFILERLGKADVSSCGDLLEALAGALNAAVARGDDISADWGPFTVSLARRLAASAAPVDTSAAAPAGRKAGAVTAGKKGPVVTIGGELWRVAVDRLLVPGAACGATFLAGAACRFSLLLGLACGVAFSALGCEWYVVSKFLPTAVPVDTSAAAPAARNPSVGAVGKKGPVATVGGELWRGAVDRLPVPGAACGAPFCPGLRVVCCCCLRLRVGCQFCLGLCVACRFYPVQHAVCRFCLGERGPSFLWPIFFKMQRCHCRYACRPIGALRSSGLYRNVRAKAPCCRRAAGSSGGRSRAQRGGGGRTSGHHAAGRL